MKTIKFVPIGTALILLTLLFSCKSNYRIISDQEKGIDFSKYSTFDITDHEHGFPLGANTINKQRIERAIISELENIGIRKTANSNLEVAWFIKINTKEDVSIYRNYYDRWHMNQTVNIYQYQEGSLVIDFIDTETNQVIWHARATDRVYDNMPDIDKKIKTVVKQMIKRFKNDTNYKASKPFASTH